MTRVWRIVPASDAPRVRAAPEQRARHLFLHAWERLRGDEAKPAPDEKGLRSVDEARVARLVPEPPRDLQRAAIDAARGDRERLVILRPGDGSWDAALAETPPPGGETLPPPDPPPFRAALPDAVRARLDEPAPLHLTRLEGWFVRHHDGLAALRAILGALEARRGPWSVDVTPWAWAWVRGVLPEARALPPAHVTAPLDGDALAGWIAPPPEVRVRGPEERPDETFFRGLALRSRGEPGVAAAVWRACLRSGAESADASAEDAAGAVWVRRPSEVDLPTTNGLPREDLIVLHAVLVHGAPDAATLARALPLEPALVRGVLAEMTARELLHRDEAGRHRVRPEAIPAVAARLRAEAFLLEPA